MVKYEIKRNNKNNLHGDIRCPICNKVFEFEENRNSNAVATDIQIEDNNTYVRLNMTSKCSHCRYIIQHYQVEKNNTLK